MPFLGHRSRELPRQEWKHIIVLVTVKNEKKEQSTAFIPNVQVKRAGDKMPVASSTVLLYMEPSRWQRGALTDRMYSLVVNASSWYTNHLGFSCIGERTHHMAHGTRHNQGTRPRSLNISPRQTKRPGSSEGRDRIKISTNSQGKLMPRSSTPPRDSRNPKTKKHRRRLCTSSRDSTLLGWM